MRDVCRGPSEIDVGDNSEADAAVAWTTVAAGVAALPFVTGLLGELAHVESLATAAFTATVVAGGATFAPDAVRGLRRGRLGVGLRMTIGAIGALVLGQLKEPARA